MRVLILGGSGFLGKSVCKFLYENNYDVAVAARKNNSFDSMFKYLGNYNLGDDLPNSFLKFDPEVIINLVWEGIPNFTIENCLKNINNHCKFFYQLKKFKNLKKYLVSGSCMEYGNAVGKCTENDFKKTNSFFSWSKNTLAEFLFIPDLERKFNIGWFRIFYAYGPGQRLGSLIPSVIRAFKNNLPLTLNDPKMSCDFIHIDDISLAFLNYIKYDVDDCILNVGSGKPMVILEIVKKIELIITKASNVSDELVERNAILRNEKGIYADISQAKSELNWNPKITIDKGLEHLIYNE